MPPPNCLSRKTAMQFLGEFYALRSGPVNHAGQRRQTMRKLSAVSVSPADSVAILTSTALPAPSLS